MIRLNASIFTIVALELSLLVTATPAPAAFSMAKWVEDLIVSPHTALSVQDASAACSAQRNAALALPVSRRQDTSVQCTYPGFPDVRLRAATVDAAACVRYLIDLENDASNPKMICPANLYTRFCKIGNVTLDGESVSGAKTESKCVDVARGAARVIDACGQPDGTTGGIYFANGNADLRIYLDGSI